MTEINQELKQRERPNKILHFGNYDAVVPKDNFEDSTYADIQQLIDFIETTETEEIKYSGDQDFERRHFEFPQDNESVAKFFIKKKKEVHQETLTNLRQNAKEYGHAAIETKNRLHAISSVLNEINNVPLINSILESQAVRNFAQKHNLAGVELIPPVFALNDRESRDKYLVYPNMSHLVMPSQSDELKGKMESIQAELKTIFVDSGISPQDYGASQFLYDKESSVLYLIDTEAWFKTPSNTD